MQGRHPRPVGGVILSLVAVIARLFFIKIHALYWSNRAEPFQNIVVTVVTLGITGVVIAWGWVIWNIRHVKQRGKPS